ncbi:hypothetical protein [Macromonas nakdongensis]|uniref:hypothetical protein n=1 Tax=Macromonas nakdongensis TaxID=1843082 RepID=UPI0012FF3375|nr:hypothetical protein [Macromonas nakdongensis]
MPKFKITKTFAFAHRGCDVVEYHAGTEVETEDQALIDVLLQEKWGQKVREARSTKAAPGAPETKGDGTDTADGQDDDPTQPPEVDPPTAGDITTA